MHEAEQLAQLAERLVTLESLVTYLDKTLVTLNEVVIDQARQLDLAKSRIEMLTSQLSLLREPAPEPRKPEDEKPPHY